MSGNMILFLIIIMCILLFILFNYLCDFITWISDLGKTTPKITFKAFKKVYCLYPSKWDLRNTYVDYYPKKDCNYMSIDFKYFHDYLLYCRFKKKIKKNHDYEKQLKNEKELIECLQKDVNAYRDENLNEINKIINK